MKKALERAPAAKERAPRGDLSRGKTRPGRRTGPGGFRGQRGKGDRPAASSRPWLEVLHHTQRRSGRRRCSVRRLPKPTVCDQADPLKEITPMTATSWALPPGSVGSSWNHASGLHRQSLNVRTTGRSPKYQRDPDGRAISPSCARIAPNGIGEGSDCSGWRRFPRPTRGPVGTWPPICALGARGSRAILRQWKTGGLILRRGVHWSR